MRPCVEGARHFRGALGLVVTSAFAVGVVAAGCSRNGGPPRRPPLPAGQAEAGGPRFLPAATIVDEPTAAAVAPATVVDLRAAAHEGFDRVTIELAGSSPGYRVAWRTTKPRHCGSGEPLKLAGPAWLEVRLDPAQAHDAEGRVSVAGVDEQPGLASVRSLEIGCDFEAVVSWALGAPRPLPFRVLALNDPPRVVVDVAHAADGSP
jgi:hypothetical protein